MISIDVQQQANNRHERIIFLLAAVADNELHTHKLYSEFLASTYASSAPEVVGLFEQALDEDRDHFHAVAACLERLNAKSVEKNSPIEAPKDHKLSLNTLKLLFKTLHEIEAFSVKAYSEICCMTLEYDYRTFDLSYRNMNENMHHLNTITDILTTPQYSEFSQGK